MKQWLIKKTDIDISPLRKVNIEYLITFGSREASFRTFLNNAEHLGDELIYCNPESNSSSTGKKMIYFFGIISIIQLLKVIIYNL